jgi:SpoVK/Ycf46/Vps4 family AAA+-type ATPase
VPAKSVEYVTDRQNRITNIDDAFHSRIHLTINYPNLSTESRRHIWSTFLGPKTVIKPKEIEALARIDLNGRQIKNVIKTAQMLARSESGEKDGSAFRVKMKHVQTVLAVENRATSD